MRGMTLVGLCLVWMLAAPAPAAAQTGRWPGFRGPDAGAVADDPRLPDTWSETENVVWAVDVPGLGWSSPVVWDDHVFVTTAVSAGEERPPRPGLYDPGADFGAVPAAAEHDGRLYIVNDNTAASFLLALDARTGREVWRVERDENENWASPFVWENDLRTEIVTAGAR